MTTETPVAGPTPITVQTIQVQSDADLLRLAFRRRAEHVINLIVTTAPLETLERALEAPTDVGALALALSNTSLAGSALDLDPLTDALARGTVERERLASAAGGLLSAEQMGWALGGIAADAVDERRRAKRLLAVQVAGNWHYPIVQVGADRDVPSCFPAILQAVGELGMDDARFPDRT